MANFLDFLRGFSKQKELREAEGKASGGKSGGGEGGGKSGGESKVSQHPLDKSKLSVEKVSVQGKTGSYAADRWKNKTQKEKEQTGKTGTEHPNDSWEHTKSLSYDSLGETTTATDKDTGKSVMFPTTEAKEHYDKNFKSLVSYNDLHGLVNPTGKLLGNVSITPGDSDKSLNISFSGSKIADIKEKAEGKQFAIELKLNKETDPFGGEEHLSKLTLSQIKLPQEYQGQGFMRDFVKQSMPTWDKLGINKINATADLKNGGYALAKYGLDFSNKMEKEKYDQKFRQFVKDKGVKLSNKTTFEHSWDIANTQIEGYQGEFGEKIGKEFMTHFPGSTDKFGLSNAWQGQLDLSHGSKTRVQFTSYANGKVLPKEFEKMKGAAEKHLLKNKNAETQLKGLIQDRIHNPLISANAAYKKGDMGRAYPDYQKALEQIHQFRSLAPTLEPGLRDFMNRHLDNMYKQVPFEAHGNIIAEPGNKFGNSFQGWMDANVNMAKERNLPVSPSLLHDMEESKKFSTDPANSEHPEVAKAIDKFSKEIQPLDHEKLALIDSNGKTARTINGVEDHIDIKAGDMYMCAGKIMVHNHPSSCSFSEEDISMACKTNLSEIRAVGKNGTVYSMRPPEGNSTFTVDFGNDKIIPSVNKHDVLLTEKFTKEIRNNAITLEQANQSHFHELWKAVAAETGLRYSKTKIKK